MGIRCPDCPQIFTTIASRNTHMRLRHIACDVCKKKFKNQMTFNRHLSRVHNDLIQSRLPDRRLYECQHCHRKFLMKKSRDQHITNAHLMADLAHRCPICRHDFKSIQDLQNHKRSEHIFDPNTPFVEVQNAFRGTCSVYRLQLPYEGDGAVKSVDECYESYGRVVRRELQDQLTARGTFKVWIVLFADLYKVNEGQMTEYETFYFRSGRTDNVISDIDDVDNFMEKSRDLVRSRFDSLLTQGSNWSIYCIHAVTLEIGNVKPLNGSCITDKISIAHLNELDDLKLIFEDDREFKNGCLFYALAKYFTKSDDMDVMNKWIDKELKRKNIKTPVSLHKLDSLEKQNKDLDFKINVFELEVHADNRVERKHVYPLRSNPLNSAKNIVNVLWVRFYSEIINNSIEDRDDQFHEFGGYGTDEDASVFGGAYVDSDCSEAEDEIGALFEDRFQKIYDKRGHFMLIENLDTFLHYNNKRHICSNCLTGFRSFQEFEIHENVCMTFKEAVINMPKPGTKMKFRNFNHKFKLPFVIFYDFEAILKPVINPDRCFNCMEKNVDICNHKIKVLNRQIPASYAMLLVDLNHNIRYSSQYTGEDCVQHFLESLFEARNLVFDKLKKVEEMIITDEQEIEFENATHCHICERRFLPSDENNTFLGPKCHDHDHFTGLYLGPSHNQCNLKRRTSFNIPAVCHNNAKYDSHFVLTELNMILDPGKITAIPSNTETFKTFSVGGIQFLDSLAFLNMSLAQLVEDLKLTPNHEYKIIDNLGFYNEGEKEKRDLLLSKQIFPYEHLTSFDSFDEPHLPPKEKFFSTLSNKGITDEDYAHACKVFKMLQCKDLGMYTEIYCMLDVGLLAEVVLQFRNIIFEDGQLDLFHYISLPQLTLDYMLKKTGNEIELLSDSTMHAKLEQGIRGGVVFCAQRYIENDPTEQETDVIYVDKNNLYGQAMSSKLPIGEYEWCDVEHLNSIDWLDVETDGDIGYILEVDLDYPEGLHAEHADFPVAPVNTDMTFEMLGPYAKECLRQLQNRETYRAKKLIASLEPKRNYLTHFANLKYYLKLGLKLRKIHLGISFRQEYCFQTYVAYCTEKRKNSVSKFQGGVFKTLSNSLFGKTMESKRDRLKCSFTKNQHFCRKFVSESDAISLKVLNKNLVCVFRKERVIEMDKPIIIGFSILEAAKLMMYELYYEQLKPKFALIRCIYTDTDSLLLFIKKFAHDVGKDTYEIIKDIVDFSNYPKDHKLYNADRKNRLGFVKNELAGTSLLRFVGLRSKTYCIETVDNTVIRKAKGISYNFQQEISFDSYMSCLFNITSHVVNQCQIRSYDHKLVTQSALKISFSSFDDKRIIYPCAIHTTAYGDYRLRTSQICPICNVNDL